MTDAIKVTVEAFKRDPDRYLSELGEGRLVEVGEDIVIISKADLEGYKNTIELLRDWVGGTNILQPIAEADPLPENLILEKLNAILAWQEVRGKQLDQLEGELHADKGGLASGVLHYLKPVMLSFLKPNLQEDRQ
jgi:hypothetical protein